MLDKTGTVTTGRMSLVDVALTAGTPREEALRLAGAVENASEHPVARAIAAGRSPLAGRGLPQPSRVSAWRARSRALRVVGRPPCSTERGLALPAELAAARSAAEQRGQTAVAAAWDGEARAIFVVADTLKPTSREAVAP